MRCRCCLRSGHLACAYGCDRWGCGATLTNTMRHALATASTKHQFLPGSIFLWGGVSSIQFAFFNHRNGLCNVFIH